MSVIVNDWAELQQVIHDSTLLQVLITVFVAIIVQLIVKVVIGVFIERLVRRRRYNTKADRRKQEKTLKGVLQTMSAVIIWTVAFLFMLTQIGVNLSALITSAGLIGVIFGWGAQSVIKDFVAGLFVIGENQYRVGDIVEMQVGSQMISGTVEDLTIRITRLRDLDGNLHVVSNGTPLSVTNLSYKYANVNIDIVVSYDADIDRVERIINEVGKQMTDDEVLRQNIFEPIQFLRIDEFDPSGIRIKSLGRVEPAEQWAISGEFRRRIKKRFDEEDIELPIPSITVYPAQDSEPNRPKKPRKK